MKMSLRRKAFVAVGLLVFSSLLLFILSNSVFLSRSRNARLHLKDAMLQAVWAEGHLADLIDREINKKVVKNMVGNMSSSVSEVVFHEQIGANKTPGSSKSVRNPQPKSVNSPGGVSKVSMAKKPPKEEENTQCLLAPESCLLTIDLGIEEKKRLTSCLAKAVDYVEQQRVLTGSDVWLNRCSCHLRKKRPDNRRVALISLPGSGNTWVRGLLEHATKVCTGAMWCDPNLRASQFCGEGLHGTRVLVVKNHDPTIRWRGEVLPKRPDLSENNKPEFDAAIFVHRDPYDAMVAERNREVGYDLWETAVGEKHHFNLSVGHHIQSFGAKYFRDNVLWNHRVKDLARIWETMIDHLLIKNTNMERVLVVKYEDLVRNTQSEVLRMLKFLGFFVAPDSLKERLKVEFSAFKRNHSTTFEHFTPAQKQLINTVINNVSSRLKSHIMLPLKEYMRK